MNKFLDPLEVRLLPDGRRRKLLIPLRYMGDELITVPEGFITDYASVPRIFWNIIPPSGRYARAAVLHDYLYKELIYDRLKCDQILLEAMKALNVAPWKRQVMFLAVRAGGWITYNRYKKEKARMDEKSR